MNVIVHGAVCALGLCVLRSYGVYRTPEPFCPSHSDRSVRL